METEYNLQLDKTKIRPISIVAPTTLQTNLEENDFSQHDQPDKQPSGDGDLQQQMAFVQESSYRYGAENLGSLVDIKNLNKTIHTLQQAVQSLQANFSHFTVGPAKTDQTCQNSNVLQVLLTKDENNQLEGSMESKKAFLNEQLKKRLQKQQTKIEAVQLNPSPIIPIPPPFPSPIPQENPTKLVNSSGVSVENTDLPLTPNKITPTDAFRGELKNAILEGGLTLRKTKRKVPSISDKESQSSETNFTNLLKPSNKTDSSSPTEIKKAEPNQATSKQVSPIIEEIRKKNLARRHSTLMQTPNQVEKQEKTQLVNCLKPLRKRTSEPIQHQTKLHDDTANFGLPFAANLRSVANKPSWCVTKESSSNDSSSLSNETEIQPNEIKNANGNSPFTPKLRSVEKPRWCVPNVSNENKENCALEQRFIPRKPETLEKPLLKMKPTKPKKTTIAAESNVVSSETTSLDSNLIHTSPLPPPPPPPPIENVDVVKLSTSVALTTSDNDHGALLAAIQGFKRDSLQSPNKKSTDIKKPTAVLAASVNDRNSLLSQIQGFKSTCLKDVTMSQKKSCTTGKSANLNINKILASALQGRFRAYNGKTIDDSDSEKEDTDQADEDGWAENCEE